MEHLQQRLDALKQQEANLLMQLDEVRVLIQAYENTLNKMTKESADSVITSWSLTGAGLLVGYIHQALGLLVLVASLAYTLWKWRRDWLRDKNAN
jgi:hypothetical protein